MEALPLRVRIALVGVGPHSEASWLPAIKDLVGLGKAELSLAIDIVSDQPKSRLAAVNLKPKFLVVDDLIDINTLSTKTLGLINKELDKIDLVIVATEAKSHLAYALWAVTNNKHVIIDKPLSSRAYAISDPQAANGLVADWKVLQSAHAKHQDKLMIVNAHRRFEPAYLLALNYLQEVGSLTGVGLTYAYLHHSDGQWRTAEEMDSIAYHGYLDGTGKIGHSGYHFIDYWSCAVAAATPKDKLADEVLVSSTLHQPDTYLAQVDERTNQKFLKNYTKPLTRSVDYKKYGEVDAFASASLLKNGRPISHMQLAMTHSGISQRSDAKANKDLYRSNGRVRHVYMIFQQGPFQTITISSEQAFQPTDKTSFKDKELGGNNHLDVTVWRNQLIDEARPIVIRGADLMPNLKKDRRLHEMVKADVLKLAVDYIKKPTKNSPLFYSDIDQHQVAPEFARAMYLSHQDKKQSVKSFKPQWPNIKPPQISIKE